MKKLFIFFLIVIVALCSCNDTRVIEIDNVTWKNSDFNIVATSDQLQKQSNKHNITNYDDYYSSITLFDIEYSCEIYIANGNFMLNLYNSSNNEIVYFYRESEDFLWGHYDFTKVKNKEYKYSLTVSLINNGQYYEYCIANNIVFPKTIILYGYEK